jgi:hypothetical protein
MGESQIRPVLGHLVWIRQQLDRFSGQPAQHVTRQRVHNAAMLTRNAAVALQWRYVYAIDESDQIPDPRVRSRLGRQIDSFIARVRDVAERTSDPSAEVGGHDANGQLIALIDRITKQVRAAYSWGWPEIQKMPELLDRFDAVHLLEEYARHMDPLANGDTANTNDLAGPSKSHGEGLRNTLAIALSPEVQQAIGDLSPQAQQAIHETTRVFLKLHAQEASGHANTEGRNRWASLLRVLNTGATQIPPPAAG